MKKFLSLMLAMIMVMSLVTVGAGAAFEDAEKIQYADAVEVMSELGILGGYSDDTFRPQNPLTRQVAAKIIAYIALGTDDAEDLICVEAPFKDVAATKTLAPYINWAAKEGIVTGYDDGTFAPEANVSGHAFLKMVLGALGIEGTYEGEGWRVNVTSAASEAGLFDGIDTNAIVLRNDATRELACQIAFNAMFYTASGTKTLYTVKTGTTIHYEGTDAQLATLAKLANTGAEMVQTSVAADSLGFENFNLVKSTANKGAYGRPATVYAYGDDDDEVIIEKTPTKVYENGLNEKTLHTDLGYTKASDVVKLVVIEDGRVINDAENRVSVEKGSDTSIAGKGTRVEIYKESGKNYTAVIINTYAKVLAETDIVDEVAATATADKKDAYIVVEGTPAKASDAGAFKTAAYEEGDVILYTKELKADGTLKKIKTVAPADIVVAKVEKFADGTSKSVTVDGTKRSYSENKLAGTLTSYGFTSEYLFALDTKGNVIYSEIYSPDVDALTNYAYITKIQTQAAISEDLIDSAEAGIAVAQIILPDGTKKVVDIEIYENDSDVKVYDKPVAGGTIANGQTVGTIAADASAGVINSWFAYEVNEDGTYTFSALAGKVGVVNGLTLVKGTANSAIVIDGDTYYTTSKTAITAIDNKQVVTKATGLVEIALTGKVLYTYNTTTKTILSVCAVEQAPATLTTTSDFVYALSEDAQIKGGKEWSVLEGANKVTVQVNLGDPFSKGDIFTLTTASDGKVTADMVIDTDNGTDPYVKKGQTVALVDDTFVVVGTSVYTLADGYVTYNVADKAVDTIQKGDICTFLFDKNDEIIAIYITKAK